MWGFSKHRFSIGLLAAALALTGCASNDQRTIATDLSSYDKVMIEPVEVYFDKNWKPVSIGTSLADTEVRRERMREEIAALFDTVFREELTKGGHLEIVDRPGPGVVHIKPVLADVYVNSPLVEFSSRREVYVRSVGHVALVAALRDSVTGKELLVIDDMVHGRDLGLLRPANPMFSRFELSVIFRDWGQVFREDLLKAN